MKLGGLDLAAMPTLPALSMPRLPLAAFRRRIVVRGVFLALMLATLALAVTLLTEERQRSRQRYESGFAQTLAGIDAQLRHPTGQLALLNAAVSPSVLGSAAPAASAAASATARTPTAGRAPLLLPFSALDFDDPFKARQAVEMSGCALRWPDDVQLCVAVGGSAYAGGFVYLVARFAAPPAVPRPRGALALAGVHRARLVVHQGGQSEMWTAPFEAAADAPVLRSGGGLRGRLTGFPADTALLDGRVRPDRDFRGWLWQDADCAEAIGGALAPGPGNASMPDCARPTLLSIRVPVGAWREGLFQRPQAAWPPSDLSRTRVAVQWLGAEGQVLFDGDRPGAAAPFALDDLAGGLASGESLRIMRAAGNGGPGTPLVTLRGGESSATAGSSPWLLRLIRQLPLDKDELLRGPLRLTAPVVTPGGRYELALTGDFSGIDRSLGATATRLSWFVAAMLGAIALAWLVIELGFMRRMALLTQRAAALSHNMQDPQIERRLGELDVADLRGKDELGILAGTLAELLQRVKEGVRREHLRAEQERDQWHAVGHEIMSPLQSLMVLHGDAADASHRYVQRMQQAVRVLYGSASPSEAIASAALQVGTLEIEAFLRQVAANAAFAGIADVQFAGAASTVQVRADEYSLEDVITHVLRNADRHRRPGSPISLALDTGADLVEVAIHNQGAPVADDRLESIFEYGVSDAVAGANAQEQGPQRGQGLFVARTYMAKMGGTITVRNERDGVSFVLGLARAAGRVAPSEPGGRR